MSNKSVTVGGFQFTTVPLSTLCNTPALRAFLPDSQPRLHAPQPTALPARGQCGKCPGFRYLTNDQFKEHCKSDWHVSNLKRLAEGKSSEAFESWAADESSSSCSDEDNVSEESEEVGSDVLMIMGAPWTRVGSGVMPKALMSTGLIPWIADPPGYVAVLLLRSGRFAGAVWTATGDLSLHTTFRRYTVRRKQGGSQLAHDMANNRAASSVGANIRRQQEVKMQEDLVELINVKWKHVLADYRTLVFVQVSKLQANNLLLGPLENSDRVIRIPMTVHTPSFKEACRVYDVLTRVGYQ